MKIITNASSSILAIQIVLPVLLSVFEAKASRFFSSMVIKQGMTIQSLYKNSSLLNCIVKMVWKFINSSETGDNSLAFQSI